MSQLVFTPIWDYHTKSPNNPNKVNGDDLKADIVFDISNRIMGLSDQERENLGISDDFFSTQSIYQLLPEEMGGNGQIRFVYDDNVSTAEEKYYRIDLDINNDGFFMELPHPDDASKLYTPSDIGKVVQNYPMTSNEIKNEALKSDWNEKLPKLKERWKKIGLGAYEPELNSIGFNLHKAIRGVLDFGQTGAEQILQEFGFNIQFEKFQRESENIIKREAALNRTAEILGDQLFNTALYGGLVEKGDQIMKQQNILFNYTSEWEGGYKADAYEVVEGGGDWTIGHGLSLNAKNNPYVWDRLKELGYDPNEMIAGNQKLKYKDSVMIASQVLENKFVMAKTMAEKHGLDITGNRNSYLAMVVTDLAYQGMLGDNIIKSLAMYQKTGDIKYLGTFNTYNEDGSALRGSDPAYSERAVTVYQELANDGMAYKEMGQGGVHKRMLGHFKMLEAWSNGQHTNFVNQNFNADLRAGDM